MTFVFYLLNNEEADPGFSALKSVLRPFGISCFQMQGKAVFSNMGASIRHIS